MPPGPSSVPAGGTPTQPAQMTTAPVDGQPSTPPAGTQPDETPAPGEEPAAPDATPPVDEMPVEPVDETPVDPIDEQPAEPDEMPAQPVEGAYEPCSGEPPPALQLTEVLGGMDSPIAMVTPAGDPSTFFVAERSGNLLRFSEGSDTPTTLLSLNTSTSAECGFLGIALHPNFDGATENRIYVSFTPTCPASIFGAGGSSALEEYVIEGDTATLSQSFFGFDQPEGNHNGGNIAFGPDGYLYYGLGDGGGGNDEHGPNGNGQDVSVPLGAILRFDVDAPDTPPAGNLTSADAGGASVDARILHYGVRNPWRFSFDKETGDLYIGDVGQDTSEEVSFAPAGSGPLNFGWSAREGMGTCPGCGHTLLEGTTATDPIYAYDTPSGAGGIFQGSVTGGFVYRGTQIPGLIGRYIFADYVRGDIFALTYDGQGGACDVVEDLIPGASIPGESLASFAQDADGEVYVLNMARGNILRIEAQ